MQRKIRPRFRNQSLEYEKITQGGAEQGKRRGENVALVRIKLVECYTSLWVSMGPLTS